MQILHHFYFHSLLLFEKRRNTENERKFFNGNISVRIAIDGLFTKYVRVLVGKNDDNSHNEKTKKL